MDAQPHIPVLVEEVLALLSPRKGATAVDATTGLGGHSALLAEVVGPAGRLVLFDRDADQLAGALTRVEEAGVPARAIHDSFARLATHLVSAGTRADILLADLGFSSLQMDDPARGFSFREDAPLDMRYDRASGPTAAQLLATLSEAELAEVIFRYGEEPLAGKIARIVVRTREKRPILTTAELVAAVREAYGARARTSRIHPATRTFMALRIAVNDELGALEALLDSITLGAEDARRNGGWLNPGARVGIISFHSLEDRLVKRTFAALEKRGLAKRLTKKPVTARAQEVHANPRARSAKLRAVRIDGPAES